MNFIMTWLPYILMVIGGVVALVGMSAQKKGEMWGQPVSVLGALLAVGAAIWNLTGFFRQDTNRMKAENRYQYVMGKIAGEYLAQNYAGKSIAVVIDPLRFMSLYGEDLPADQKREDHVLKGLKDGVGSKCPIEEMWVEYGKNGAPKAPAKPAGEVGGMPPMMMVEPTAEPANIDKMLAAKAKKHDIIVLTCPIMAMQFGNIIGMNSLKGKEIVLINQSFTKESAPFFAATKQSGGKINKSAPNLILSVVTRYNADFDNMNPSSNDQKAFDIRYSIITPDNYESEISKATTMPAN